MRIYPSAYVKPPRLAGGGWECGPGPDFALYTLALALQLRKITGNLSQGSRKALVWSAPTTIRLVDLAIASDDHEWPAGPCRPWLSHQATGSTLGQRKYLPSCRTRGSPRQLTFSQSSQSGLWCGRQTAEHPHHRVSACYLRTTGQQQQGKDTWIVTPVACRRMSCLHEVCSKIIRTDHSSWSR